MSVPWSGISRGVHRLQRQTVTLSKGVTDGTLALVTFHQDMQEKLLFRALDVIPWIPEEARRVLELWADASRRWREDFRASVYRTFELTEQYLDRADPALGTAEPRPGG